MLLERTIDRAGRGAEVQRLRAVDLGVAGHVATEMVSALLTSVPVATLLRRSVAAVSGAGRMAGAENTTRSMSPYKPTCGISRRMSYAV